MVFEVESEVEEEFEQYLCDCNYPKLERLARRQRKRRAISEAFEHVLVAEAEFQSRLLVVQVDSSQDEMAVVSIASASLERGVKEVHKGLKVALPAERLILHCMLGKLLVFQAKYQEALDTAFKHIDYGVLLDLVRQEGAESPQPPAVAQKKGATAAGTFQRIVALQACYALGVACEMVEDARSALNPYSDVTDFCRRFPDQALLKTRVLTYFVGMAMYRYGMLCARLVADPRALQGEPPSAAQLKSRLLFDASVSLRMYLTFAPAAFGLARHSAALASYLEVLEARFRRSTYRNTFDPEQYALTSGGSAARFCPENTPEDAIYCIQLLESLQPIVPSSKEAAQSGSAHPRVRSSIARLARYGDRAGLLSMTKSLFTRFAADASTFGYLVLSAAAAGQVDEACRAGEIYASLGGRETSVLLALAKTCLQLPSKLPTAISVLGGALEHADPDMSAPLLLALGAALLLQASSPSPSCAPSASTEQHFELAQERRARAVGVLQQAIATDGSDPVAHLYLAVAYAELRKLGEAEASIKTSLSLEADQPLGWYLMGLIKSGQRDYATCLSVCNSILENLIRPDIRVALLKIAALMYSGLYEEAGSIASMLISLFTEPSGPVFDEATAVSGATISESTILDPAQFRARFYPTQDRFAAVEKYTPAQKRTAPANPAPHPAEGLTVAAHRERFPESASRLLAATLMRKTLFPESVVPSEDLVSYLANLSVAQGERGAILCSQQLWCLLGEIYLCQGRTHEAEMAAHEAFMLNELSMRVSCLRGRIMETKGYPDAAMEAYQSGLPGGSRESIEALLRLSHCHARQDTPNSRQLGLHFAMRAAKLDPSHLGALALTAEHSRVLGLEDQARVLYGRALLLEETEPLLPFSSVLEQAVVSG